MAKVIEKIKIQETRWSGFAEQFLAEHPYVGSLLVIIGMPLLLVCAVGVCAATTIVPLSCIMGWM